MPYHQREVSQDGRNLLLKEDREGGRTVTYQYVPQTNLVSSKFVQENHKILIREFFEYDRCLNLIKKIIDDGISEDKDNLQGVTERHITKYFLRQQYPHLHMPEWIEECYLENGLERLLQTTRLSYDQHGNVNQEDLFDALGNYVYSIHKGYNECGDLINETNPLGRTAFYEYDEKGNLIAETKFSHKQRKEMQYDARGRLKEEKTIGNDGIIHQTSYFYDLKDRCIRTIDPFQNAKDYTYDLVSGKITETKMPNILSANGNVLPVSTFSERDPFGREKAKIDANKKKTNYSYTVYGSPYLIEYPDGGKERFEYSKEGKVTHHIDPDGNQIQFIYDILGRVILKNYYSPIGQLLASESFEYSSFHLIKKTDKEENVTHYSYDGAGRKIREEFCGRFKEYAYDTLGRLSKVIHHNGENPLVVAYRRDILGRIIEERNEENSGRILSSTSYTYDEDGNQSSVTHSLDSNETKLSFIYDSLGRIIEKEMLSGMQQKSYTMKILLIL